MVELGRLRQCGLALPPPRLRVRPGCIQLPLPLLQGRLLRLQCALQSVSRWASGSSHGEAARTIQPRSGDTPPNFFSAANMLHADCAVVPAAHC